MNTRRRSSGSPQKWRAPATARPRKTMWNKNQQDQTSGAKPKSEEEEKGQVGHEEEEGQVGGGTVKEKRGVEGVEEAEEEEAKAVRQGVAAARIMQRKNRLTHQRQTLTMRWGQARRLGARQMQHISEFRGFFA